MVKAVNKIGASSSNTISVDTLCDVIEPTNQAPTPTFTTFTMDEDTTYSGTLTATDPESDALTFAKASNPTHGSVSIDANGNFTYVPTANYNGSDSFSFTVSDGVNAPVTQLVSIHITDVAEPNQAPTPTFTIFTMDEDTTYSGTLTATDPEDDALTFAKASNPTHGSVSVDANGNFTYVPTANYNGSDSFSFTVSDGVNAPVTQVVSIHITDGADPNQAPTADAGEDKTVTE
jgi:VCBS repeat-containing protein